MPDGNPTTPSTADKHRGDRQGTHANTPKPPFRQTYVLYKNPKSVYANTQVAKLARPIWALQIRRPVLAIRGVWFLLAKSHFDDVLRNIITGLSGFCQVIRLGT